MSSGTKQTEQSGFSTNQLRKLLAGVDPRHVHTREIEGRQLSYIEGWYAIAQANEVFGHAGWDRQTVHLERILERSRGDTALCGYIARVSIRVRTGQCVVTREGTGWGWASARTAGAAHERALKSAETDATKRALSTFGARFGLTLYDREAHRTPPSVRKRMTLFAPDGQSLSDSLSPEGFSSGLRQLIEACRDPDDIDRLSQHNAVAIADLRAYAPALRNSQGTHFADLLLRLLEKARRRLSGPVPGAAAMAARQQGAEIAILPVASENFRRPAGTVILGSGGSAIPPSEPPSEIPAGASVEMGVVLDDNGPDPVATTDSAIVSQTVLQSAPQTLSPPCEAAETVAGPTPAVPEVPLAPSRIAPGARIDKSRLRIGQERRLRDKNHLRHVGELPCLICNRQPSHAHHLKFAQRRGLSQKVSDEFVVPLCAIHHADLHNASSERQWWKSHNIKPLEIAQKLWN